MNTQVNLLKCLAPLMVLSLTGTAIGAVVLMNDTFSDADRTNQALPGSAQWFSGGVAADAGVSGGEYVMSNITGSTRGSLAYFTGSGSPQTLGIGDSLQFSFNFKLGQLADGDERFQFALFDSGGSRAAVDGQNFNNSLYANYTGYKATLDPDGNHHARYRIAKRNTSSNNLVLGHTSLATTGNNTLFSGSTWNTGTLTLLRTGANSMQITSDVNGQVHSTTDTSAVYTSFDTVGVFAVNYNATSLTLDNVVVTYTAIPEPGSMLLLGIGTLLLFVVRRAGM